MCVCVCVCVCVCSWGRLQEMSSCCSWRQNHSSENGTEPFRTSSTDWWVRNTHRERHAHTDTRLHARTYTHRHTHARTHTHTHTHTQTRTLAHTHAHTHTHTHTHIWSFVPFCILSQFEFITEEVPEELISKCYSVNSPNRNTNTYYIYFITDAPFGK